MNLTQVKIGQLIYFSYSGEGYTGKIVKITPVENRNKYVVQPLDDGGPSYSKLWLYDGDEEEWQVGLIG